MADSQAQVTSMSAVKLALLARQMRSQVEEVLRAEPIAVIGMGCRVPGADSLDEFWELLINGVDAIREVPDDRWDIDSYYDADFNAPGKISTRSGGFLNQIDSFDPTFFGISPREAERMDPQQRLFLEVAYEALEDAGITNARLNGSQTGVFVASYHDDYSQMQYNHPDAIDGRTLTGALQSIVSNRLSFLLNIHGPSITLDTACSSSLVAIHLACQNLRNRECDMAIAGGVNVMISAELNMAMSRVGFLSPRGRCRTFDAGADGFVRGEGCGIIVLKRLSDAISDGDHIRAVIRGSAVNQDGRSNVLTAPNGMAHRLMLRAALENAGLSAEQITYIEAHGTGTALGDPIEVEAVKDVLGAGQHPLILSSVKTNIGHLEAAAGVIGVIKSALSLEHEVVPGNVHFTKLNPHINLDGTRLVISKEPQPWRAGDLPRFVGVSSFGVGGTNAHVILEAAPQLPASSKNEQSSAYFLPLSAHTESALRQRAADIRDWLNVHPTAPLNDLVYTASARRNHYDYRLGIVGASQPELVEQLNRYLAGEARPGISTGYTAENNGQIVFVFSGQGPQWWAMGRELLAEEAVFRQTIEQIDSLLQPLTGWSLLNELQADEQSSRLDQTEVAQPAIFALQVALAALWQSWGIVPDTVVGHSVGEIAAAHVAGILSLEDAVQVVYHRSRLMQRATGFGKMAAVELPAADAERAIAACQQSVSVAAINSPTSVTLSGEPDAVEAVVSELNGRGVITKMLRVNYAFHSPQMQPFQTELTTALRNIKTAKPVITIFSTVTGQEATAGDFGAEYWARNIRQPVRFADAINGIIADGGTTFLEISPHPALASSLEQCLAGGGVVLHSLRRGRPERSTLLNALSGLYTRGYLPDWKGLYPQGGDHIHLPEYPWQRQRYWLNVPKHRSQAARPAGSHPLLGKRLHSPALRDVVFEAELSDKWPAFIDDHRVYDLPVLPATAYAEMILAGLADHTGQVCALDELLIQTALVLDEPKTVQTILREDGDHFSFEVVSLGDENNWIRHATGRARRFAAVPEASESLEAVQSRCTAPISADDHYEMMNAQGLLFGSSFKGVTGLWCGNQELLGRVELPDGVWAETNAYLVYPPLLDASLQLFSAALNLETGGDNLYLPLNLGCVELNTPLPNALWSHVRIRTLPTDGRSIAAGDVCLYDDAGVCVGTVQNVEFILSDPNVIGQAQGLTSHQTELLYETVWKPAPLQPKPITASGISWLVVANHEETGQKLASSLQTAGYSDVQIINNLTGIHDIEARIPAADNYQVVYLTPLDMVPGADPQSSQQVMLGGLLSLAKVLPGTPTLYLVTKGAQSVGGSALVSPEQAPIWGMGSTLAMEFPNWRIMRVDLDPHASNLDTLVSELAGDSADDQIAYRNGQRYVARLNRLEIVAHDTYDDRPVRLEIPASHVLDDLAFRPSVRRAPGAGEVELRVIAAGLNFRDILKTLGMYPGPAGALGDECSGEVVAVGPGVDQFRVGDRVVGVVPGALATYVTTRADLLVHLPETLSEEDAAGIPIPFLTAHYALNQLAHLQPGQRVLIHAAAGGVGLAAVQLALLAGAEIYATAGSPEKRAFLHSVGIQHVFNSRNLDFAEQIMEVTGGEGVDVVLNSLAGEFIPKSMSLLRAGGCFLEIGKTGIWEQEQVSAFKPDIDYHVIFLAEQFDTMPELIAGMLAEIVNACAVGQLRVLPKQVFPATDVTSAFRFMAQARHIGKIIIAHQSASPVRADASYLITGGMGGIGLEVAQWLAEQGARQLILMGRQAPSEHAQQVIDQLRNSGVEVIAAQGDVANEDDLQRILNDAAAHLSPLRGIFHCAGINADGPLVGLDWSHFEAVMAAKITGAWNLHRLTQGLSLDHFVLFSSIAANLGSAGQANYAAANAYLDGLAHWRRAQKLPALSINWGPWENLGMTARLGSADVERLRRRGMRGLKPSDSMDAMGQLLSQPVAQATILNMDWKGFARAYHPISPFYSEVVQVEAAPAQQADKPAGPTIVNQLRDIPANQRRRLLLNHIREQAAMVLGLPASVLSDPRQPLNAMGLDSLMATELRNALVNSTGEILPTTLVFDYPSLDALTDHILNDVLGLSEAATQPSAVPSQSNGIDELADLSDDEAEALLLEELTRQKKKR